MTTSEIITFLILFLFPATVLSQTDNVELSKMYNDDQEARRGKIDWTILIEQDQERQKRVFELIKSGQVKTGKDYYNSAMIFQHGGDTIASSMAVKHMRKAIELDSTINKWLLAAAIDRDLMRRKKPQIYGTQFVKNMGEEKWKLYTIDTTQVNDEDRKYYGVETLAEQAIKLRSMNLKPVSDFHSKESDINEILKFIRVEHRKGLKSEYNVGVHQLSSFGHELIKANKKNEALKLFKLNTKLYPTSYKTFDSLGECLLLLDKKEKAIKAYKRSLELNPKNEVAKEIIKAAK